MRAACDWGVVCHKRLIQVLYRCRLATTIAGIEYDEPLERIAVLPEEQVSFVVADAHDGRLRVDVWCVTNG